jgi:hypothetical protein
LVSATPSHAQCAVSTDAEREITGRVVDQYGEPIYHAVLEVRDYRCSTLTDSSGAFSLRAPNRPVEVLALYIGYQFEADSVLADGPQVLNFTLRQTRERVRDWSRLDDRPASPSEVHSVAGCYWLGVRGAWPEVIELRADGSVPEIHRHVHYFTGARGTWRMADDSRKVIVEVGGGPMFEFDFAQPVDWSVVPAVLRHRGNMQIPNVFDSFVTRVDCPTGQALPN